MSLNFSQLKPLCTYGEPEHISQITVLTELLCFVQSCKIHHSVIGLRSCISAGTIIKDTLLMGADYYEVMVKNSQTICKKKDFVREIAWSKLKNEINSL